MWSDDGVEDAGGGDDVERRQHGGRGRRSGAAMAWRTRATAWSDNGVGGGGDTGNGDGVEDAGGNGGVEDVGGSRVEVAGDGGVEDAQ